MIPKVKDKKKNYLSRTLRDILKTTADDNDKSAVPAQHTSAAQVLVDFLQLCLWFN